MIAGPLHTRHLLPTWVIALPVRTSHPARDHGAHLDLVPLVQSGVAGNEGAVADHQMGLTPEPVSTPLDADAPPTPKVPSGKA